MLRTEKIGHYGIFLCFVTKLCPTDRLLSLIFHCLRFALPVENGESRPGSLGEIVPG
jgi:hypothetical protein